MVYLDLVMALNFAVDYLLILGVNALSGFPPGYLRGALAAILGGVYGGVCLIPGFGFLGNAVWRLVFLAIMGFVAFGYDRSALRRGILLIVMSMALGGIAQQFQRRGAVSVLASAVTLVILCNLGFRGRVGRRYHKVELRLGNQSCRILGLLDTGNALRDPITGLPVLIVGEQTALELLGLSRQQLLSPAETAVRMPGFRLIPYRAVGCGGMLLAKRLDEVRIDGKISKTLVAFAPQSMGNEGFDALLGGMCG